MSPHPIELLTAVENTDASLLDKVRAALSPQGTGPVAVSANFTYIVCMLMRGETPLEVSKTLEQEKKEILSPTVIRDYALQHIPAEVIRPNLIFKYMAKGEEVDEIQILETAVKIQRQRVAGVVDLPTPTLDDRENARREVDLLAKLAVASLDAKIKTGLRKSADEKPPVTEHKEMHLHIHGENFSLGPRQAGNVLSALAKIRALDTTVEEPKDGN